MQLGIAERLDLNIANIPQMLHFVLLLRVDEYFKKKELFTAL